MKQKWRQWASRNRAFGDSGVPPPTLPEAIAQVDSSASWRHILSAAELAQNAELRSEHGNSASQKGLCGPPPSWQKGQF